jgi:hypothetical protein
MTSFLELLVIKDAIGDKGNKHIFIGNNCFVEIRLGFIKIGSHCYQWGSLYERMPSRVVHLVTRENSNIGKHTLCSSL